MTRKSLGLNLDVEDTFTEYGSLRTLIHFFKPSEKILRVTVGPEVYLVTYTFIQQKRCYWYFYVLSLS